MRLRLEYCLHLLTVAIISAASVLQAQQITIQGNDLVCNGESFFQASNICSELSRLARQDGILAQGDNFKQIAVSGAPIANILNFYKSCNPKPTYLVSDGAGIDLMSGNCSDVNCSKIQNCANTLRQYLEEMKKSGTKKLLWMIYPDPQPPMGSATLKKNQDLWAQVVPDIMAEIEEPKVYLVDLRETWDGHYNEYTSDGIHCSSAGGTATAEAFWEVMKADDYEFFNIPVSTTVPKEIATTTPSIIVNKVIANGNASVSLSVNQSSNVSLQLITATGRSIFNSQRLVTGNGQQKVVFPIGPIAAGIYCCTVTAGQQTVRSTLMVP